MEIKGGLIYYSMFFVKNLFFQITFLLKAL
jgi:hypothetical protein